MTKSIYLNFGVSIVTKVKQLFFVFVLAGLGGCELVGMAFNRPMLVVDLDAVAKATGRQEVMQKELEFANLRLSEQLKLVASQLEGAVSDEKDKLGKSPSKEQKKQLESLAIQAQQQLVNSKNLAVQQSTDFRSDLILRFREEVAAIAQEIATKAGSKMVMISSYETLWFDPAADITDEVISIMRARGNDRLQSAPAEQSSLNQEATPEG